MKFYITNIECIDTLVILKYKYLTDIKNKFYFKKRAEGSRYDTIGPDQYLREAKPIIIEKILAGYSWSRSKSEDGNMVFGRKLLTSDNSRLKKFEGMDFFLVNDMIDERYIIDADSDDDAINKFKVFIKTYNNMIICPRNERQHFENLLSIDNPLKGSIENCTVSIPNGAEYKPCNNINRYRYYEDRLITEKHSKNLISINNPYNSILDIMIDTDDYWREADYSINSIGEKLSIYFELKEESIKTLRDLDTFLSNIFGGEIKIDGFTYDYYISSIHGPSVLIDITPLRMVRALTNKKYKSIFKYINIADDEIKRFILDSNYRIFGDATVPGCLKCLVNKNLTGRKLFSKDTSEINISDRLLKNRKEINE